MLILGLDAALARCSAAVAHDGRALAERHIDGARGQPAALPGLARAVLTQAGIAPGHLDAIAVTVGPGSFTGLRAALALAHGLALATGRRIVGVSVAEALAEPLEGALDRRNVWTAIDSRRSRVFLEIAGAWHPVALDALPRARGRLAIAGDAAIQVAARLAARGDDVMLTGSRLPLARHVAAAGARRIAGLLPPLPAQPLYIDPPDAKLPAGGLRPYPLAPVST